MRCGVWLLAIAVVVGPGRVQAQRFDDSALELAFVSVYDDGLQLQSYVDFSQAIISVSGGDVMLEQAFAAGEYLSISGYDDEGNLLPDGTYSWELKLIPNASAAKELRLAASKNGGEAPNAWRPQSGVFTIRNGVFASPDLVEEVAPVENRESVSNLAPTYADSFGSSDRVSEDSDAAGASEVEVQAAAAIASPPPASSSGAGFQAPDRSALGDSDSEAELLGRSLEAQVAPASATADGSRAPVPYRSIEPGGTNGRPTGDEDSATQEER